MSPARPALDAFLFDESAGLTNAELGLRLRYEVTRQFAPYIGVSYDTKVGHTAADASQTGRSSSALSLVAGVRVWF